MFLRQVELIGFKSFAERTLISFHHGITAIVGPNGCGKSNILDAIRWVLGEQSSRELRTLQMADVIFNGNENRPPLGMAEVTLTLDNHDGKLPIEFAEVQITRKVYRSGEGEYFINKSPCRLKDIIELFMDTGIGTDSYSIIGQGKIDQIISTHPEDRRELFEEVAGVLKYKHRRKVALKKIELAEQNLLRLQDVITEIERQLRSLRRQAQSAQRYRNLLCQLKELEIRNAWFVYNQLQGNIEDERESLSEKKSAYEQLSKTATLLESQQEELYLRRLDLEREVASHRDELHKIENEMNRLENELNIYLREIEYLNNSIKSSKDAEQEKLNRLATIDDETTKLTILKSRLAEELTRTQQRLSELNEEESTLSQKITTLQGELQSRQEQLIELINSRNRLQSKIELLNNQKLNIEKQIFEAKEKISELQNRVDEIDREKEQVEIQKSSLEDALTNLNSELSNYEVQMKSIVQEIKSREDSLQKLREEFSRTESRLTSLRELRERYEGYAGGVRAVMNARNEGILGGEQILGPIGDLIKVEPGYEVAIESALGGNINNIVVRTAEHAKLAIAFLKQNLAGRVTFLPLDTLKPSSNEDINENLRLPGVLGHAIDYVSVPEEVQPALNYVLYNTYIVSTIDEAILIAKQFQNHPKLVTLEGEVITSAGTVTGGRTKYEAHGLLSRATEIQNLESKLQSLSESITQSIEEIRKLLSTQKQIENEIATTRQKISQINTEIQNLTIQLTRTATTREQFVNQIDSISSEITLLTLELEKISNESAQIGEHAHSEEFDEGTIKTHITQLENKIEDLRHQLECKRKEISDYRVLQTEQSAQIQNLESQIAKICIEKEEILSSLKMSKSNLEETLSRIRDLQEEVIERRTKLSQLSQVRDSYQQELLKSQEEYQKSIGSYEDITKKVKELRAQLQEWQEEIHALELKLSQLSQQSEFLRARIIDEYKTDLNALTAEKVGSDDFDENERTQKIEEIKQQIQRLGTVNPMAIEEYEETEKRHQFFLDQQKDLIHARDRLKEVIEKIDSTVLALFTKTFKEVGEQFKEYFRRLFGGGHARIYLVDESNPLESGIEIEARPPGKKPQTIHQLSGGEQALTAIALLFAIFKTKPSPFCILDEVDAPLDDNNINRFLEIVEEFAKSSQFILITHNKQTMTRADAIIGITQQERGVSEVISVKLKGNAQVPA